MSLEHFKDHRGEIRRYEIEGTNFNALYTKEGCYRSGDYHPVTQFDMILKGKIEVTTLVNGIDVINQYENCLVTIPSNVPHLFKALTDCVMIEWWDGPLEVNYYQPYRKFIK